MDRIKLNWYTTTAPPLANYHSATRGARKANLEKAIFSKTWVQRPSGLPTIIAPRISRIHRDLYSGKIPTSELDQHFLVRNVALTAKGKLSSDTIALASALRIPHHLGAGGPDDFI